MRLSRKVLRAAAIAAAAVASMTAAPAHADSTGLFNISGGNCGQSWRQVCLGYGQGVPIGLSSLTVEINCSASTPFVVDRTGVGCYLVGMNDGQTYAATGPFFVAGNSSAVTNVISVPFQGYRLCVGAGYSTSGGAFQPVQNYVCN